MKFLSFFLCLFIFPASVQARQKPRLNSSPVVVRSIQPGALRAYKNDSAFQYDRYQEPPKSLWDKFWAYVWYQIQRVMSSKPGRTTVYTVLFCIGLAIVAFFIRMVFGMNKTKLFARATPDDLSYQVDTDNIHEINFETAISKAIADREFRLAIRLLYLHSLKILADTNTIDWRINKTNSDYLNEVSGKPWSATFAFLTRRFEYAWYGEIKVEQDDFEKLHHEFKLFTKNVV